jgi:hypothetical protein
VIIIYDPLRFTITLPRLLHNTGSIGLRPLHCITLRYLHLNPTAIMSKSCGNCSVIASPDLKLLCCAGCQTALYCSKACQREDWKKQHKKICKLLNVGDGDMQVRANAHINRGKERFERGERSLDGDKQLFFKLFTESTFEGSRAAAQKMKKYAKGQIKYNQHFLLFHSMDFLARCPNSEMLSWPNSPLLVLLQFVDPSVSATEDTNITPLHQMADVADAFNYSTHQNQLILAKQLIEHGANVNAVTIKEGLTPLHRACYSGVVTNLDYVEYLLEAGADPNARDHEGVTPLMFTAPDAPSAAKFLLNWPTTDVNITSRIGESFHDEVREAIEYFSDEIARPDNPEMVQHQFATKQWLEIQDMLVLLKRGAANAGIATPE